MAAQQTAARTGRVVDPHAGWRDPVRRLGRRPGCRSARLAQPRPGCGTGPRACLRARTHPTAPARSPQTRQEAVTDGVPDAGACDAARSTERPVGDRGLVARRRHGAPSDRDDGTSRHLHPQPIADAARDLIQLSVRATASQMGDPPTRRNRRKGRRNRAALRLLLLASRRGRLCRHPRLRVANHASDAQRGPPARRRRSDELLLLPTPRLTAVDLEDLRVLVQQRGHVGGLDAAHPALGADSPLARAGP